MFKRLKMKQWMKDMNGLKRKEVYCIDKQLHNWDAIWEKQKQK